MIKATDIIEVLDSYYGTVRAGIANEIAIGLNRLKIGIAEFYDMLAAHRANDSREYQSCPTWYDLKRYIKRKNLEQGGVFESIIISDPKEFAIINDIYKRPSLGDAERLKMIAILKRNATTECEKISLKWFVRDQAKYMTNPPAPDSRDDVDCRSGAGG